MELHLATLTALMYTDAPLVYNWVSKPCSNLVRCQSCLRQILACVISVLTVPYHRTFTFMLCILKGASAAEENSGIVGNGPSASNACNGGQQSHHRATHDGQVLGSYSSPHIPLQPKDSQLPAAPLSVAKAGAGIPLSTWRQVTCKSS